MKRFILASLLTITTTSFAWENPDRKGTCYLFKNNKLQQKSTCMIQSGGGAGAMYLILKMNKKSYHFETETISDDEKTVYYPNSNLNNPKSVITYQRNTKTLKILKDSQITADTDFMFCHKTQDGKIDICSR